MDLWELVQVITSSKVPCSLSNVVIERRFYFVTLCVECQEDLLAEQAVHSQITSAVLAIFFLSLLGVGVGQTAVSTLGIPYIDDNVASRESPIYIGK